MTVETEVATLTTAVDNLTTAVNVSKATLDSSVASSLGYANTSNTHKTGSETAKTGAEAARDLTYTYSQNAASAVAYQDLTAIAQAKSVTATDVFVYDTSKDSDGGAWRKRTQATSWYNETLNTATRGSRKEFPAVAVIVAEAAKVTIYDGDDPDMPMWMVFNVNGQRIIRAGTDVKSVQITNGVFVVGASGYGLSVISFIEDNAYLKTGSHYTWADPTIAHRNINTVFTPTAGVSGIVSSVCNDIAMTVLPNAPIDSSTGLPIPTIAIATAGGVSVIKDDGSVVSGGEANSSWAVWNIMIDADNRIWVRHHNDYSPSAQLVSEAPYTTVSSIGTGTSGYQLIGQSTASFGQNTAWPYSLGGFTAGKQGFTATKDDLCVGATNGFTRISDNATDRTHSSVAYITSDYNTGYMVGDIKLAALSDTDDTDVVGTELVTNGDFTSGLTGWTAAGSGVGTWAVTAGSVSCTGATSFSNYFEQTFTCVIGETYTISLDVTALAGTGTYIGIGTGASGRQVGNMYYKGDVVGTYSFTFTATQTTHWLTAQAKSGSCDSFGNVSVRLADTDRSVNANGLAVHGTITKSAVATGADLVGYSGFSTSNYLEQPYNSDLDFGTGDFSVMGWVKANAASIDVIMSKSPATGTVNPYFEFQVYSNSKVRWFGNSGTTIFTSTSDVVGRDAFVVFTRVAGVGALYIDGVLEETKVCTDNYDHSNADILRFGYRQDSYSGVLDGSLALWRISATAPTAAQIKTIYEAEKPLFQENAQATLYGTSDAVTALAHDSDTDLLHVGTSSGRSVFKGLRRVDNTTTAVGAAISAANGLVVED